MREDVIYLKVPQCVQVCNKKIYIKDVAEIQGNNAAQIKKIQDTVLYTVKGDKDEKLVFSVMKVIQMLQKESPQSYIENVGEPDFIVEYHMPNSSKKGWEYVKLAILSAIVFVGAAFTIMTFNTDVSVGEVFDNVYKLVLGNQKHTGHIVEIAYSIGILVGILGFYNHFKNKSLHEDPTPIHIEMHTYEEQMNKAIIKNADREGTTLK